MFWDAQIPIDQNPQNKEIIFQLSIALFRLFSLESSLSGWVKMWGKDDKELGCAKAGAVLLRGWFFHGKRLFFSQE